MSDPTDNTSSSDGEEEVVEDLEAPAQRMAAPNAKCEPTCKQPSCVKTIIR